MSLTSSTLPLSVEPLHHHILQHLDLVPDHLHVVALLLLQPVHLLSGRVLPVHHPRVQLVHDTCGAGHVPRDWSVTHTRETELLPRANCDTRGPGAGGGGLQDHWRPVLHIPDISAIANN